MKMTFMKGTQAIFEKVCNDETRGNKILMNISIRFFIKFLMKNKPKNVHSLFEECVAICIFGINIIL